MQSQILRSIDTFATMFANSNRRKGKAPMKAPKQTQPDYVEKAKKDMVKQKTEENKEEQRSLAEIFEKRNSEIKQIEEISDGT